MRAYQGLPVSTAEAIAVQVSSPPLTARTDLLARAPQVLPVVSLGEHHPPGGQGIDLADLLVTADESRLILVSRSLGCAVEPLIFNAVDLRHRRASSRQVPMRGQHRDRGPVHPAALGTARQQLPFLPRVRAGRIILSPARWNLTIADLPDPARISRRLAPAVRSVPPVPRAFPIRSGWVTMTCCSALT